tara:strand:- start:385 stop:762 length:378 start_codon:yes stop_codon:yes gene_type:complete
MARFYDSVYDPLKDSGSSGIEISDLNPEKNYDIDLRRVEPEYRESLDKSNNDQTKVKKFMKAVKSANAYRQRNQIKEPTLGGRIPVGKASINGVELPSLRGRNYGDPGAGATEYAHKPKAVFGSF